MGPVDRGCFYDFSESGSGRWGRRGPPWAPLDLKDLRKRSRDTVPQWTRCHSHHHSLNKCHWAHGSAKRCGRKKRRSAHGPQEAHGPAGKIQVCRQWLQGEAEPDRPGFEQQHCPFSWVTLGLSLHPLEHQLSHQWTRVHIPVKQGGSEAATWKPT